jgi:hypothetical protein
MPTIPGIPTPHLDLAGTLAAALHHLFAQAIQGFASAMFAHLSDALLATTAPPLGASFDAPWRAMLAVAGLFAVPIVLAGVVTEMLAGRPGQALRRGVLFPLLIGPVLLAARALLGLLDALVQGACGLLVQIGLGGRGGFSEGIDRTRQLLGITTGPADPTGAGASLAVVLVAGLLAFIIWIELAVRAALLVLLAAFVPLALAGMFWSVTARWTRRLLETLAAVLLAPVVITTVMVLATATLTAPIGGSPAQGVDQVAVALALLFLGTLGLPLTFRVIPLVVEAALVTGAGAHLATRARRGATRLATAVPTGGASRLASAHVAGSGSMRRPADIPTRSTGPGHPDRTGAPLARTGPSSPGRPS